MGKVILDTSALLAVLEQETGGDIVLPLLPDSRVSAVNAAEAQEVLIRKGKGPLAAWRLVTAAAAEIVPFDAAQARICGDLSVAAYKTGISAGDRACLALAIHQNLPVYTADQGWRRISTAADVRFIR